MRQLSIYGSVGLKRDKCPSCKRMAFVGGGIMFCCDKPVKEKHIKCIKRESETTKKEYVPQSLENRIAYYNARREQN